jgi:ABC-type glycerol-3-phosphate transport system substrate-binding protein
MAGLDVQGFAISAGTEHPELAYELVKYATNNAMISQLFYGTTPARRTLVGAEIDSEFFFQPEISPEAQAVIDNAIENGLPSAELRFGDYVDTALNQMREEGAPAQIALQEAEAEAIANLQTAADQRDTNVVIVSTPVPTPVLTASDVALRFQLSLPISPLPNREEWDRLIAEFTASDPEVRYIEIVSGFGGPQEEQPDCIYQDYNSIPWIDMEQPVYLNIDPFTDADPNFDRSDFIGDALAQVERDNKLWALPIVIQPEVLWYDEAAFLDAGVLSPVSGWTVDEFNDALRMLKTASENGAPPFVPENGGGTYLLMLMAAYGAVPYDTTTDPPTLNLTDPTTIETMRQVLNLAKDGYIDYRALADFGGGFGGSEPMITADSLNAISWRLRFRSQMENAEENTYRLTTYPRGSQFTPISYNLGLAYIGADTLNPEACYRWISTIAQHPELFMGMPVRRSMLASPDLIASQGEDVIAAYRMFDASLQDPNAIIVPSQNSGSAYAGSWIEQRWINKVFDNYVLEDSDLEADVAQTVDNIEVYRACLESLGEFDAAIYDTPEKSQAFWEDQTRCAITIEPELAEMYGISNE